MKQIFIDCETTGTDHKANGLIQLAGLIVANGEEEFNFRIKPMQGDVIEDSALAVSGVSRQDLDTYPEGREVYANFVKLLGKHVDKFNRQDKFIWVGYNARFDSDFVRAFFEKNGDQYFGSWFFFPPIDVMNLAAVKLMESRATLTNFKLGTVADRLGVVPDGDLHDALVDIRLTRKLFQTLTKGE